jgi:hypothetical protein
VCGTARPNWNRLSFLDVAQNFFKDLVKWTFRRGPFQRRLRARCRGIWFDRSGFLFGSNLPNQSADFLIQLFAIVVRISHRALFHPGGTRKLNDDP